MSIHLKSEPFNPNNLAVGDGVYGLPFNVHTASQVIIPVPWEATVSYRQGTAAGPEAILQASRQVDLYDADVVDAWKLGLAIDDIADELTRLNEETRRDAKQHLANLEAGVTNESLLERINANCERMNKWVRDRARHFLDNGKFVYLVGGDHSTPLGLIQELAARGEFGILHFDAHADLRDAYEGFEYSHASIMFNVMKLQNVLKLVQVGIRDYCEDEVTLVGQSKGRIEMFTDREIKSRQFEGDSWRTICDSIIRNLPQRVYVSFDVDGLDPKLCPNTGTPVPGGLDFEQALFLVKKVVKRGRTIIGFDVNEVAPGEDEWDACVGARLVYRIANLAALSNKLQPVV
jgi:agmatinase